MKNKIYYSFLIMLSFALMSSTCSSDDGPSNNDNSQEIIEIENTAESGNWIVSSYVDSGQDETNDFAGYVFTFSANGTVMATNGTTTYNGTWSVTDSSNSSDDSSDDDIDFNLSFPVPDTDDFDDLNDDWDIVSYSATTISLIDVSGGNGGTDTLVFQKN